MAGGILERPALLPRARVAPLQSSHIHEVEHVLAQVVEATEITSVSIRNATPRIGSSPALGRRWAPRDGIPEVSHPSRTPSRLLNRHGRNAVPLHDRSQPVQSAWAAERARVPSGDAHHPTAVANAMLSATTLILWIQSPRRIEMPDFRRIAGETHPALP